MDISKCVIIYYALLFFPSMVHQQTSKVSSILTNMRVKDMDTTELPSGGENPSHSTILANTSNGEMNADTWQTAGTIFGRRLYMANQS